LVDLFHVPLGKALHLAAPNTIDARSNVARYVNRWPSASVLIYFWQVVEGHFRSSSLSGCCEICKRRVCSRPAWRLGPGGCPERIECRGFNHNQLFASGPMLPHSTAFFSNGHLCCSVLPKFISGVFSRREHNLHVLLPQGG
jgi:hypothetical protein